MGLGLAVVAVVYRERLLLGTSSPGTTQGEEVIAQEPFRDFLALRTYLVRAVLFFPS